MATEKPVDERQWWVAVKDRATGPYSTGYVVASLRSRLITADQLVCPVDGSDWQPAQNWPSLKIHLPTRETSQAKGESLPTSPHPAREATVLEQFFPPTRVVQALAVYGLAVNPLVWLVSTLTICLSGTTFAEGTDAQGGEALLIIGSICVSLCFAAAWIVTGWFLNRFDRRGLWWAVGSCTATWFIGFLFFAARLLLLAAFPNAEQRVALPAEAIASLLGLLLDAGVLGFETAATILLFAYRQFIPWQACR